MIRRLLAVLVALACFAGLPAAASPGAGTERQVSVDPTQGSYRGHDAHYRTVSFTLVSTHVMHFTVNDHDIGSAAVPDDQWSETCHRDFCTKGRWESDTEVVGEWRHGDGHWVRFSAHFQPASSPVEGSYRGYDHSGRSVEFVFGGGQIGPFEVDREVRGGGFEVRHSRFEKCGSVACVKGHWQTNTYAVGVWRPADATHWVKWQAHLSAR